MNKNANRIIILVVVLVVAGAAVAGYLQSQSKATVPPAPQDATQQTPAGTMPPPSGQMPPVGADAAAGQEIKISEIPADDYDQGVQPSDSQPLPTEIAGLPRTAYQTGPAAVDQITKMHGIDVTITNGQSATYEKGEEKITVWVSENKTNADARALMKAMLVKMETPKFYTVPVPLTIKDRIYFQAMGNDMQNYFYLRGNRIFWVGLKVASDKAMPALKFVVSGI
jgi:hypothetical protein